MSQERKKALSYRQAASCESATKPRCRCRCGGTLHGAKRADPRELPSEDPHHAIPTCSLWIGNGRVCGRPAAFLDPRCNPGWRCELHADQHSIGPRERRALEQLEFPRESWKDYPLRSGGGGQ